MYAKIFGGILDSSLAADWSARHVFMDLLVLADRAGEVDMTLEALARRINYPGELEELRAIIEQLKEPDPISKSEAENGARIIEIRAGLGDNSGWIIVNYQEYRELQTQEQKREKWRRQKANQRARKSGEEPAGSDQPGASMSADCPPPSAGVSQSPPIAEAEAEAKAEKKNTWLVETWQIIKEEYPPRSKGQGWAGAEKKARAHVKAGRATMAELLEGAEHYRKCCEADGSAGGPYVKQAETFFGPGLHWQERPPISSGEHNGPAKLSAGQRVRNRTRGGRS